MSTPKAAGLVSHKYRDIVRRCVVDRVYPLFLRIQERHPLTCAIADHLTVIESQFAYSGSAINQLERVIRPVVPTYTPVGCDPKYPVIICHQGQNSV